MIPYDYKHERIALAAYFVTGMAAAAIFLAVMWGVL